MLLALPEIAFSTLDTTLAAAASAPSPITLGIFVATYIGLALGKIPGLGLDRTGFALLGAIALLIHAVADVPDVAESLLKSAVHVQTLSILFGMMLLSAQYQISGLYGRIVDRLAQVKNPYQLLFGTIVVVALLSALLTNDVVCFAVTPLLMAALIRARLNPLPFLLAVACASNIGSALTPIGNPQNIFIQQKLNLPFLPFVLACALPVVGSLAFMYWLMARHLRRTLANPHHRMESRKHEPEPAAPPHAPVNRAAAGIALGLTAASIAAFLIVPAQQSYLAALAVAGVVFVVNRKHTTRELLALVDWSLLMMFIGLFVVVHSLKLSGWTELARQGLEASGGDLAQPMLMVPVVAVLSNLVSNVPAVMLMTEFLPADRLAVGYGLALSSTLAGNMMLISSIANLIVAEQAARFGVTFGFREHITTGLIVTAVSLTLCVAAMLLWPLLSI